MPVANVSARKIFTFHEIFSARAGAGASATALGDVPHRHTHASIPARKQHTMPAASVDHLPMKHSRVRRHRSLVIAALLSGALLSRAALASVDPNVGPSPGPTPLPTPTGVA